MPRFHDPDTEAELRAVAAPTFEDGAAQILLPTRVVGDGGSWEDGWEAPAPERPTTPVRVSANGVGRELRGVDQVRREAPYRVALNPMDANARAVTPRVRLYCTEPAPRPGDPPLVRTVEVTAVDPLGPGTVLLWAYGRDAAG